MKFTVEILHPETNPPTLTIKKNDNKKNMGRRGEVLLVLFKIFFFNEYAFNTVTSGRIQIHCKLDKEMSSSILKRQTKLVN